MLYRQLVSKFRRFAFYGSAKRGAAMTAYNRVNDKVIMNHEKYMEPDYVFVIDPASSVHNRCND
jgi:Pyruvate ferredoxin/flavodoxin oxidoreductase.